MSMLPGVKFTCRIFPNVDVVRVTAGLDGRVRQIVIRGRLADNSASYSMASLFVLSLATSSPIVPAPARFLAIIDVIVSGDLPGS